MILGLFRRSANETVIERLYAAIVAASRERALYAELGIPDTFEGRFESLTLHAVLVLRYLKEAEAPGPEVAQDLVDTVFKHFDRTLREMGVGDTSIPKRMKSMAEAFLGRSTAYDEAMRGDQAMLAAALRRNVYRDTWDAAALARYVAVSTVALAEQPLQTYIDGMLPFPDPATFVLPAAPDPDIST